MFLKNFKIEYLRKVGYSGKDISSVFFFGASKRVKNSAIVLKFGTIVGWIPGDIFFSFLGLWDLFVLKL